MYDSFFIWDNFFLLTKCSSLVWKTSSLLHTSSIKFVVGWDPAAKSWMSAWVPCPELHWGSLCRGGQIQGVIKEWPERKSYMTQFLKCLFAHRKEVWIDQAQMLISEDKGDESYALVSVFGDHLDRDITWSKLNYWITSYCPFFLHVNKLKLPPLRSLTAFPLSVL